VNEKLLTVDEAAEVLRIHPETARKWVRAGRIAGAFKLGRVWRVRLSELTAWMDEATGKSRGQTVLPHIR